MLRFWLLSRDGSFSVEFLRVLFIGVSEYFFIADSPIDGYDLYLDILPVML